MKLVDNCPVCVEPASSKEYKEIPDTLCPACVEPEKEPKKPTIKMTEYCLRAYMRNVVTKKYCKDSPHGCS